MNNYCIAKKNKNTAEICSRKTYPNSLFCGYHQKFCKKKTIGSKNSLFDPIFNIKENDDFCAKIMAIKKINNFIYNCYIRYNKKQVDYLNANYKHCLLYIYSSWEDVPKRFRINIKDEWWDIRILLSHFSQGLNNCNMGIASPQYPSNPFNRQLYKPIFLTQIFNRVKILSIPINIALYFFYKLPYTKLYYNYYSKINTTFFLNRRILKYFSKNMRFKIINCIESQYNFIGHWVRKKEKIRSFEKLYNEWLDIPAYQFDNDTNFVFNNPKRDEMWEMLRSCPMEIWDINNDPTTVLINK